MIDLSRHKFRFFLRMGILVATWIGLVIVARRADVEGFFGALIVVLAWVLPPISPIIAWLDWRWIKKQEGLA